jgi:hypothetical protein
MISATGKISLIPPVVCPAVSRVSCGRPAWCVASISPLRRSRLPARLLALSAPFIEKWRGQRAQNRAEADGAGHRTDVVENLDLDGIVRIGVNARSVPLFRAGSFLGCDEPRAEVDANRASISAAAIPRPSKMPPEATTGIGDTASTTCHRALGIGSRVRRVGNMPAPAL